MSQENVQIVRQALDAYARRDETALAGFAAADVELDWSRSMGWLATSIEESAR